MQRVPIRHVLANISGELATLAARLQHVEKLLFDHEMSGTLADRLQDMQDIDLIIQQIADLGRALDCVAEADLDHASLRTSVLGDRLHLNDLRQRLLGLSEQALIDTPTTGRDVLFF